MDEARFKDLQARFGPDPSAWPAPHAAEALGRNARLLGAIAQPVDEAALSRAVLTRLAQPAKRWGLADRPALAFAAFATLALAFGIAGYQAGGVLEGDIGSDAGMSAAADLALGSVAGMLQ
jgi:hypothetical protein